MPRTRLAALALAATTLAGGGCGSSSSSTSPQATQAAKPPKSASGPSVPVAAKPSGKPLTRHQLTVKANAICEKVRQTSTIKVRSHTEVTLALQQAAANDQAMYAAISTLVPPGSLASVWSEIVADSHSLADNALKVSRYPRALETPAAQPLFVAFEQARQHLQAAAKQAGFRDCTRL